MSQPATREFNFDGLIGPTHNYAGLSAGNLASTTHRHQTSHPRAAALQGLRKMQQLAALGIGQAILPPLPRPRIDWLRQLGFSGPTDPDVVESAWRFSPMLVATAYSAASMWTANAATVSPSVDTSDHRLHFTPANLLSTLHRSLEADQTTTVLRSIFGDENEFVIHPPLPCSAAMPDEGAANHLRLCPAHGDRGIEIFVYGIDPLTPDAPTPQKFPARQSRLASQSVARRHRLDEDDVLFWQQTPEAIDAGVFHNDVIAVANEDLLLCHEQAFIDQSRSLDDLRSCFENRFHTPLHIIEFSREAIKLKDAVRSYLFNSQLVTRPDGNMTMICPIECEEIESARRCTDQILNAPNRVDQILFMNLRQSMNNGGGPACLRLRVVLSPSQQTAFHQGVLLTPALADQLEAWITTHYREQLTPNDLRDPNLITESLSAHATLMQLLGLPSMDLVRQT